MPNAVLRACSKQCSEEQYSEIKKEMNRRKAKLQKPAEFSSELKVNDVYHITRALGSKVKKADFRIIANYVQIELNK